jgi:sulfide:quinone oxidoreductase
MDITHSNSATSRHQIIIVGGGHAGISVAARLRRASGRYGITMIEPRSTHYYQPLWTLIGGGVFPDKAVSTREEAKLIPTDVNWVQDEVVEFDPEDDALLTRSGLKLSYEQLVVAPGLELAWDLVKGLSEARGNNGVCSNYAYDTVDKTWEFMTAFQAGNAIFTCPTTPVKCKAAGQKIMYLTEHFLRKTGKRQRAKVIFATADTTLSPVPKYAAVLDKIASERGIDVQFQHDLIEVRGDRKEAVFRRLDTGATVVLPYELIHVTPPQRAPDCVRNSLLADAAGWVDVDRHTLQHRRYPNIFSLGDASNLPTIKTGAAVRKQAPVLVENLLAFRQRIPLTARYEGYTSCPIVTRYGRVMLTEFDYAKRPRETFPFNQAKERISMYLLKKYALPFLYWHVFLRGLP